MAGKQRKYRTHRDTIRFDQANAEHVALRAKLPQFGTKTGYINWLIAQERTGRDAGMESLESRIAATLLRLDERMETELRTLRNNYATQNAFLHAFVKMFLVNNPEADDQAKSVARATAKQRYQRLLEQAAQFMSYEEEGADGANQED